MRTLGNLVHRLRTSLQNAPSARETEDAEASLCRENAAELLAVLRARQDNGLTTELRQLHSITDFTQGQALRALKLLETADLVTVKECVQDFFASTVTVTQTRDAGDAIRLAIG